MIYILNFCEDPGILKTIMLITNIFNIVLALIPIMLLVIISIDVFKFVITGEKEKNNCLKRNINRLIASIIVYFVPTMMTVILNVVRNSNSGLVSDNSACITNANPETIKSLEYKEERKREDEIKRKEDEKRKKVVKHEEQKSEEVHIEEDKRVTTSYTSLADKMIEVASNEIGYKEGSNDYNKYGEELGINNQPWCAIFVTWVGKHTTLNGVNLFDDVIEKYGEIRNPYSAVNSIYTFSNNENLRFYYSNYYGGSYTPKKGDYIYFNRYGNWDKNIHSNMFREGNHVGIVESYSNGTIYTIEGNHAGMVGRVEHKIDSKTIMGFGSWYR